MKLTPLIRGLITGAVMIALSIGFYYANLPDNSPLPYLIFAAYALGIVWTLTAYKKQSATAPSFGEYFAQGFKCFVIVSLMMIVFTGVFARLDTKSSDARAVQYREQLEAQKNKLPNEVDADVADFRKNYPTLVVYGAVFQFLIYGVIFTVITAGSLKMKGN